MATLPPAPAPRAVLANRVVIVVGAVLSGLLVLGAALAVIGVRSIGWSPGATTVHVIGHAMEPAIADGDYLLVDHDPRWSPASGDIVLMADPYDASRDFIKRVVAVPGQTVEIRNARVLVDGAPLAEPYVDTREPWTAGADWPEGGAPVRLGPDEYFVLGDNRNHSADSRTFGPIHRDAIRGRPARILLPTSRARRL